MIKVWGRKTSSNVQALMWCLAELQLDCDRLDIGHVHGGNDTPEFLALNPNGTIPVFQDGQNPPIWETGAILRHVASRYASEAFWPTAPVARAQVDQWAEWAKINGTQKFTMPIFWRVVRTAPSQRDSSAISDALANLKPFLEIAERQFEAHDFLAGSQFTLADIQFGHLLYRYFDIDIERGAFPQLRAYYDRLTQRAAFRAHVMVSYESLRVFDA
jgi:glutathione S-transferase